MAKKKIGQMIRELLGNIVSQQKRDELADSLDKLEETVDKLGDLVRGRDDDKLTELQARVADLEQQVARLSAPKKAARRLAAEE
ncbi:hypothetical protein L6R53_14045 [Myxococcota bacterium]|nr:hypothetical protein [Myxococcota bacterium]